MREQEIQTSRWAFVPFSMLFLPFTAPFGLMAAGNLVARASVADTMAGIALAAAFGALWLSVTLPLVRPRRLIFSSSGITYLGNLRRKEWTWTQFEGASGGVKVMLHVRPNGALRAKKIFLGPFWIGGSDRIVRVAQQYGWTPPPENALQKENQTVCKTTFSAGSGPTSNHPLLPFARGRSTIKAERLGLVGSGRSLPALPGGAIRWHAGPRRSWRRSASIHLD